jgi:hypothetical protein
MLSRKGKKSTVVATAIARELAAFMWAIVREVGSEATPERRAASEGNLTHRLIDRERIATGDRTRAKPAFVQRWGRGHGRGILAYTTWPILVIDARS